MLGIFLWMVGRNVHVRDAQSRFQHSKSTIHQQTQTDFLIPKKGVRNEAKKNDISHQKEDFLTLTKEEIKWEAIRVGIEKETDLSLLENRAYWDTQIQNLQDNLLPVNKKSIVLKSRLQQREQQLKREKGKQEQQTEAKIENLPKGN